MSLDYEHAVGVLMLQSKSTCLELNPGQRVGLELFVRRCRGCRIFALSNRVGHLVDGQRKLEELLFLQPHVRPARVALCDYAECTPARLADGLGLKAGDASEIDLSAGHRDQC